MALVLGACGDASLADVGQRSTSWIGDVEASSTTAVAATAPAVVESRVAALALTSAAGLDWVNDGLGMVGPGDDPDAVARDVWQRSGRAEAYVQAHRADIAAVLPAVKFPGAIPASVEYVTSQLIFDEGTGRLDHETTAAFGLWSVEPYSQSRAVGQQAVLVVGLNQAEEGSEIPNACDRVEAGDAIACRDISINGRQAAEVQVEGGVKFIWWDIDYRYELFYRTSDDPDVGLLMAESMVELAHLEQQAFDAYRGVAGRAPTR